MGNPSSGRGGLDRPTRQRVLRLLQSGVDPIEIGRTLAVNPKIVAAYRARLEAGDNPLVPLPRCGGCGALLQLEPCLACFTARAAASKRPRKNRRGAA